LHPSWTAHAQPEGQLYFSRELVSIQTIDGYMRLYTEAHLHEETVFKEVESFVEILEAKLEAKLKSLGATPLSFTEAVLELPVVKESDSDLECWYYMVNPSIRTVGWLETYDGNDIGQHIKGVPSSEYLCKPLFSYCYATLLLSLFSAFLRKAVLDSCGKIPTLPNVRNFGIRRNFSNNSIRRDRLEARKDYRNTADTWLGADTTTSRDSTSASLFSVEDLKQLCSFTKNLRCSC
jgi:hypothetical protein